MVPGGIEAMIGITTDPTFGPPVGFGLGGTTVEVLRNAGDRLRPAGHLERGTVTTTPPRAAATRPRRR